MNTPAPDAGRHMSSEMAEQPDVLRRLIDRRDDIAAGISSLTDNGFAGVSLIARGSSDNVAVHARYVLEMTTGRPVALAAPSLHTLYRARVDYTGQLVVAISQSGATPEIVTVLQRLGEAGARTVAVTNDEHSALARAADLVVDLGAGAELAVPATKTVTAQLAALALLARGLNPETTPFTDADLGALPDAVATVLADETGVDDAADRIAAAAMVVTVARGLLFPAALESALKVRESAGLPAEGWSAADLRHGPIAAVQPGAVVVGMSVAGPAEQDTVALLADLRGRSVETVLVGDSADAQIGLPPGDEALAAVPAIVRGQQLALATARRRGIDPDAPFGLSKITAT